MKITSPKKLLPGFLSGPVFHANGCLLFEAEEEFTLDDQKDLLQSGIREVYILQEHDNIFQFVSRAKHKTIHIDELTSQHQLSFPLFAQETGKLLFGSQCHLSLTQKEQAKKTGIDYVVVLKTDEEKDNLSYQKFQSRHQKRKVRSSSATLSTTSR